MPRSLNPATFLDTLRQEARRWLNALRSGDERARERFRAVMPRGSAIPPLREVQQALAREYGFASWTALKLDRAAQQEATRSHAERVASFLENACLHYGVNPASGEWDPGAYPDGPSRWADAASLLARHPEIARANIHAAVVAGDVSEVRRILAAHPQAALENAGPESWPPLLRLAYSRLPLPASIEGACTIAEMLLAHGADANARWGGDADYGFTPLTGVIGLGEGPAAIHPPHPAARALAELLVRHGANPYDRQALYNTALHGDDPEWLDFMRTHATEAGSLRPWSEMNWLLGRAVISRQPKRAAWLLAHGADPNAQTDGGRTMSEEAVRRGFDDIVSLLAAHGVEAAEPAGEDAFQAACMRLDREAAAALLRAQPDLRHNADAMRMAAEQDRADVVTLLLDLGLSPDVTDDSGMRPLHAAAASGAVVVAALLIERGADVDAPDGRFDAPPLGWAIYHRQASAIDLIGRHSRALAALSRSGNIERLRQLFTDNAALAHTTHEGRTLFAALPDDEARALEVAELFLEYGVDPSVPLEEGLTLRELAARRGFDDLVDLLDAAGDRPDR